MIGIYFSGTGNTQYCIKKFVSYLETTIQVIPLETAGDMIDEIRQHQEIIFAYPVYYSNLPKIVRDFITNNSHLWEDKSIFVIATMGLFSGDGAGVAARLLVHYGANILGGLHIKMPDCICDVKTLKRTPEKNKELVKAADHKIYLAAGRFKENNPTKEGLSIFYHIAGLLGQRLWFYNKTTKYTDQLRININKCILCKKCIFSCPMNNLFEDNQIIQSKGKCTMCYRCINQCPEKAITLLGKEVIEQHDKC